MSATSPSHPSRVGSLATPKVGVVAQALMAILLGGFLVGMAGFSHLEVVHNAAHDTRHSTAFPCH